jgi:putative glutamine amidotransferase
VSRPVIGVTTDILPVRHRRKYTVYNTYVELVRRAGGWPVGIFPEEAERVPEILERLDALILPGGDDMHPRHWSDEDVHPSVTLSAEERTLFELAVVKKAAAARLPLLGICLGCQALNVAFGGTVIQHLDPDLGHGSGLEGKSADNRHDVLVEEGTRLHSLVGATRLEVNSGHHQAAGAIGKGLRVSARAPDGVVEAIEGTGDAFLLAVQWHPEERPEDPVSRALIQGLLMAVR